MNLTDVLFDREKTHGNYYNTARVIQKLTEVFRTESELRLGRNQSELTDVQKESIEMILHKIGRIVGGDPNWEDHWIDIAGYATLAARDLG